MASKRGVRRKACTGKIKYTDKTQAHAVAWVHSKQQRTRVGVYMCKFCHTYHVGHPPRGVRQAIAAKRRAKYV